MVSEVGSLWQKSCGSQLRSVDCNTKAKGVFLQRISFSSEARHFEFRGDDTATHQIPTPEQMNCSGDLPTNWRVFLQDHFVPVRNILCEQYIFHNTEQQAHETVDQYLIKLRRLAEPCQFGNLEDEMVRDRLVLGCKDSAGCLERRAVI